MPDWLLIPLVIGIVVLGFGVPIGIALFLRDRLKKSAESGVVRILQGFDLSQAEHKATVLGFFRHAAGPPVTTWETPQGVDISREKRSGDVNIRFVTYHGFIAYVRQTEYDIFVDLNQAEDLVRKLHRFNMKYGWFTWGGVYIPFLSYHNLRREIRKIEREKMGMT